MIPRTIRIGEAPSHGKTTFKHDGTGLGTQACGNMADGFLTRPTADGWRYLAGIIDLCSRRIVG